MRFLNISTNTELFLDLLMKTDLHLSRSMAVQRPTKGSSVPKPPSPPSSPPFSPLRTILYTDRTHQLSVSGLIVFSLFLCFHHVLQLAFSSLTPLATSFFLLVIDLHDAQTSSSSHV